MGLFAKQQKAISMRYLRSVARDCSSWAEDHVQAVALESDEGDDPVASTSTAKPRTEADGAVQRIGSGTHAKTA
jgi:hypothetical protein